MAEFNKYRVYYYSAPQYDWDARIDLSMNTSSVAMLQFMKRGQSIPANSVSGGIFQIHYSIHDFPAIISMLREEKPLFVTLAANGIGTLSTSDEPVGEQEGV